MNKSSLSRSVFVIIAVFIFAQPAAAEERPVQLSLFAPIQIFPEGDSVRGLRLSLLYGRNTSVTGIDWGFVNHNTSGMSKAWQLGVVGWVEADLTGLQDCTVNVVKGEFKGVQFGIFNYANSARGLQLGLVNYAENIYGVQVGLANIIRQDGMFPVFPIVNWSF